MSKSLDVNWLHIFGFQIEGIYARVMQEGTQEGRNTASPHDQPPFQTRLRPLSALKSTQTLRRITNYDLLAQHPAVS
jgi:hypothetical protein